MQTNSSTDIRVSSSHRLLKRGKALARKSRETMVKVLSGLGLSQPESKISADAQRYWADPTNTDPVQKVELWRPARRPEATLGS